MVAHTAPTRVIHDADDAHPGGELPSIPAHLHSRILSALCDPASSPISVARDFRIAVDILALWLTEPEIREKMLRIEKGGYAHTRMAASVTLASTVNVLHTIIEDFTQARAHARSLSAHERLPIPASRHDPLPSSHYHQHQKRAFLPGEALLAQDSFTAQRLELRRADCVRRAAHHLYRLSRIVPVDDSKLALAAPYRTANVSERISAPHGTSRVSASPTMSEPRASARAVEDRNASLSERASAPHGNANVSERASFSGSQLPSQPVHPAGALQDLPLEASPTPDANTRATCSDESTHRCEEAVLPPDAKAPSPDNPSSPSSHSSSSPPLRGPPRSPR